MCRSCVHKFNGKYCQQCDICGHPAHQDSLCGVGIVRVYNTLNKKIISVGCICPTEIYDGFKTIKGLDYEI